MRAFLTENVNRLEAMTGWWSARSGELGDWRRQVDSPIAIWMMAKLPFLRQRHGHAGGDATGFSAGSPQQNNFARNKGPAIEFSPLPHEATTPLEHVTALVRSFDFLAGGMRECSLVDVARAARPVGRRLCRPQMGLGILAARRGSRIRCHPCERAATVSAALIAARMRARSARPSVHNCARSPLRRGAIATPKSLTLIS